MTRIRCRDDRGLSISVFAVVVLAALIMITGLVVDGGQKARAVARAESAAAGAARAAGNAVAAEQVSRHSDVGAATLAAQNYLAGTPGVQGQVGAAAGVVTVTTTSTADTLFLSAIGIDQVRGTGSASVDIVVVRGN